MLYSIVHYMIKTEKGIIKDFFITTTNSWVRKFASSKEKRVSTLGIKNGPVSKFNKIGKVAQQTLYLFQNT